MPAGKPASGCVNPPMAGLQHDWVNLDAKSVVRCGQQLTTMW